MISTDSKLWSHQNSLWKFFKKPLQPGEPNNFVSKFLRLSEKLGGSKIFIFWGKNFSELKFFIMGIKLMCKRNEQQNWLGT